MKARAHRLAWPFFAITFALSGAMLAESAEVALAQTSPELKFLNGLITQRAKPGDQEVRDECPERLDAYAETASTTVFVLLSGSQEKTDVTFETEMPAAGGVEPTAGSLSAGTYEQIVARNRLSVDPEPARNERPDDSVRPSEVKAFTLTFYVCSDGEAPT